MPPIALKKRVPAAVPPAPTITPKPSVSPTPSAGKPKALPKVEPPKAPPIPKGRRKPDGKDPKKEIVNQAIQGEEDPGAKAPKRTEARQPRYVVTREEIQEYEGQMSHMDMLALSFTAKHDLWRELNKKAPEYDFVTLLKPSYLPKEIRREFPPAAAKSPSREALWCPYCSEWMKFRTFSYTGYEMCIGCGMSTKDFYVVRANKLTS